MASSTALLQDMMVQLQQSINSLKESADATNLRVSHLTNKVQSLTEDSASTGKENMRPLPRTASFSSFTQSPPSDDDTRRQGPKRRLDGGVDSDDDAEASTCPTKISKAGVITRKRGKESVCDRLLRKAGRSAYDRAVKEYVFGCYVLESDVPG